MSSLGAPALVTGGLAVSRDGADGASALSALVERAREGDGRAFDRLMLETQERVMGLAWRLLGGREDARDGPRRSTCGCFVTSGGSGPDTTSMAGSTGSRSTSA